MNRNPIETMMGAVVLLVAAVFLGLAYTTADFRPASGGYPLKAEFSKVGGLEIGSDVRINGVKVGSVTNRYLNEDTYQVVVDLQIMGNIKIPEDTRASIVNDGFMGGQYIRLDPGQSKTMLSASQELKNTQNFASIEELVGDIIFLATESPDTKPAASQATDQ